MFLISYKIGQDGRKIVKRLPEAVLLNNHVHLVLWYFFFVFFLCNILHTTNFYKSTQLGECDCLIPCQIQGCTKELRASAILPILNVFLCCKGLVFCCFQHMEKVMKHRQQQYFEFRKIIAMRAKYFFIVLLNNRNYTGKMSFNHSKETLEMNVSFVWMLYMH